jgi:hypothetical protein
MYFLIAGCTKRKEKQDIEIATFRNAMFGMAFARYYWILQQNGLKINNRKL